MLMPVVNVWVVWMAVFLAAVPMGVRMRLAGGIAGMMSMLMVFIVDMQMLVFHEFMNMPVLMMFGDVQP